MQVLFIETFEEERLIVQCPSLAQGAQTEENPIFKEALFSSASATISMQSFKIT